MGRKIEQVTVPAEWGARDAGKVFEITEWPAARADEWAIDAMLAYNRGGGNLDPDMLIGRGMEAIFFVGVQTFLRGQLRGDEVKPILNQLLECVKIVRDPRAIDVSTGRPAATALASPDDIEEIKTIWWLRSEVLRVHTGFSPAAVLSRWISAVMTAAPASSDQQPSGTKSPS